MTSEMLRPTVAAERFGVSTRTLRRWANEQLIRRSQVGRVVWLNADDIRDLQLAHSTERKVVPLPAPAASAADWRSDPFWSDAPTARPGRSVSR